jgi:four helix bundle protein
MRDHTSLKAWQEAHAVALAVIELARTAWRPYASALFFQLQKASTSAQLNISEGYTFGKSPTFTRHLGVAYGSAVETGELLSLLAEASALSSACSSTAALSDLKMHATVHCSLFTVHSLFNLDLV